MDGLLKNLSGKKTGKVSNMIKPTDINYKKLISLFEVQPSLFEEIKVNGYSKDGEGKEVLYRDGESDLIEINGKIWRFNWESVEEFGIEEDED
ncbi:hypothetical protein [Nostoc sp. CMAA1605]|uniref:hypothetical protein n=1 Tax=Nostoc sp. CMAA1605 TaxID=2055159 RepID=UPI001F25093F|nr:hypothetical protein [Nostoc sp. CMAA1605]